MLTPVDIQGRTFRSGMGYNKADVDAFFASLTGDYETLYRENLSLKDKISNLNENINQYKSIEKSLQKALVLAEQTAEETIAASKTNATVIEQEAILKAQSIVADAKIELDQIHAKTNELLQQYERYRTQYRALAQAQVDLLNSEAFNIEAASLEVFDKLEQQTRDNAAAASAKAQFQTLPQGAATAKAAFEGISEDEEDDETLDADIQINDLASLFELEEKPSGNEDAEAAEDAE